LVEFDRRASNSLPALRAEPVDQGVADVAD
jgi:hypothetical protein